LSHREIVEFASPENGVQKLAHEAPAAGSTSKETAWDKKDAIDPAAPTAPARSSSGQLP
jgi:hypothetical protein